MKKSMTTWAVVTMVLAISGLAGATVTTIMFNSAEIVAPATTNPGAPAAGDGRIYDYGVSPAIDYRTYVNDVQTAGFNAWLSSLGDGEGISQFNLSLNGAAAGWGQTLVITDWTKPITAVAPAGWTANVTPDTFCIAYTTTDPARYIRPGSDIGAFSFTAETNGVVGGNYILWVGAGTEGIQDTGSSSAVIFQRVVNAQAVPAPGAVLLGGIGVTLVGWLKKRRSL